MFIEREGFYNLDYNKTDDYNFKVIRYPSCSSNIPRYIINNTYLTEALRISRACTLFKDFTIRLSELSLRFVINGWSLQELKHRLFWIIQNKPFMIKKYGKEFSSLLILIHVICSYVLQNK